MAQKLGNRMSSNRESDINGSPGGVKESATTATVPA